MAEEKLLTIRDVSLLLGISEKEVMDLADSGAIPAYKIGGVYLRFKREQVEDFKKSFVPPKHHHNYNKAAPQEYSLKDKFSDFLYFNDFYILAAVLIILILVVIFRG